MQQPFYSERSSGPAPYYNGGLGQGPNSHQNAFTDYNFRDAGGMGAQHYQPNQGAEFAGHDFGPFGATPGQQMVMDMAKQYGEQFASEGKKQIEKYVSVSKVKTYFAVDNAYVGKKLAVLLFPFAHRDWSMKFQGSSDEPVPPKLDLNAVDLYIPCMAIVTYVFVAGTVLGVHEKFSPELLGIVASTALGWLFLENVAILLIKYIMGIAAALNVYDALAFSGYKYLAMILCLAIYLVGGSAAYYWAVLYFSFAIAFFLVRSVKSSVLPVVESQHNGRKRKLYLLLCISLSQPFILYWLTSSVIKTATFVPVLPKMPILDEQQ